MEKTAKKIEKWFEEIRNLPPVTEVNSHDLKDHLLCAMDDLKKIGLKDEDAFDIARVRIGSKGIIKHEFSKMNDSLLQMQRIILPAAGVLFYFLCFYFMQVIGQIIFTIRILKNYPSDDLSLIYIFLFIYYSFFILLTGYLYRSGRRILPHFNWIVKPIHVCGLFAVMFSLAATNFCLSRLIETKMESIAMTNPLNNLWSISGYTFPLVFIGCFLLLYFKYNRTLENKYASILNDNEYFLRKRNGFDGSNIIAVSEDQVSKFWNDSMRNLYGKGLEREEAFILEMKKQGYTLRQRNVHAWKRGDYFMQAFLKILSGILFYFIIYFFLTSTARFFIWIVQWFSPNALLTIKHTWTLIISGYLLILFFSCSVFLLDQQLLQRIKKIRINQRLLLKHSFLVVFLGGTERIGAVLSNAAFNKADLSARTRMEGIFQFLHYTFPLLICICFLVLFLKYYWDNIRILDHQQ